MTILEHTATEPVSLYIHKLSRENRPGLDPDSPQEIYIATLPEDVRRAVLFEHGYKTPQRSFNDFYDTLTRRLKTDFRSCIIEADYRVEHLEPQIHHPYTTRVLVNAEEKELTTKAIELHNNTVRAFRETL